MSKRMRNMQNIVANEGVTYTNFQLSASTWLQINNAKKRWHWWIKLDALQTSNMSLTMKMYPTKNRETTSLLLCRTSLALALLNNLTVAKDAHSVYDKLLMVEDGACMF